MREFIIAISISILIAVIHFYSVQQLIYSTCSCP